MGLLDFNFFLEVERQSHLEVEVQWVLVAQGVERHGGDVVREFRLYIDANVAVEVVLQAGGGMNRPL